MSTQYQVMMHYQMRPTEPEEAEVMQDALKFFQTSLHLQGLNHDALIDVMRMVNARFMALSCENKPS